MSDNPQFGGIVPTGALWGWSTPVAGQQLVVQSYPTTGGPTKSGVMPADLRAYLQVPLQQFGNPPIPIPDSEIINWIRWAEDDIETETNIRLCQTWIAAPPAKSGVNTQVLQLGTKYGNYQQLGVDYDVAEAAYDFFFERSKDEAWLYLRLRWRPIQGVEDFSPTDFVDPKNLNGVKNIAFIYPLLNEFFRMPQPWIVEDQNRGLIRLVPATSVQMLPLFAMQLAFLGFAQSVPGGLWLQYTAGLTANDYNSRWSFMKQLVLAKAGVIAFMAMQTSVNLGALETLTQADGLAFRIKYSEKGPFNAQIYLLNATVDKLTKRAKSMGGGLHLGIL